MLRVFSSISYYSSPNWSQKCNLNIDLRSTLSDIHVITNKCSSPSFVPSQLAQNKISSQFLVLWYLSTPIGRTDTSVTSIHYLQCSHCLLHWINQLLTIYQGVHITCLPNMLTSLSAVWCLLGNKYINKGSQISK